ncbi:MAG: TonB-dependent vitamin B12 receptor [Sulfuricaulis sp.]
MKVSVSLLAASLAAVSSYAVADVTESNPVIVTATRTAQTADASLASVTVITRQDIERSQAQSISELLTGLAGIDSTVNGGYGKTTSLFLRGTNSDDVLVMIDGVKIGSATLGTTAFEFLPLDQIDHIEIVRGPRSSLYGSEAIGGVIQIFTRQGTGKPDAYASAGAGSYNTRQVSAGMSTAQDGTDISLSAARFKTGGFNAQKPTPGPFGVDEPDKDGYSNDSATASLRHRFDNGADIGANLFRAQGHTDYDGDPNNTNFVQQAVGTDLGFSPSDIWRLTLRAGQSQDDSDNFKDMTFSSRFNTQRDTASWQNDITLGKDRLLTLGVDRQADHVIGDCPPFNCVYTVDRRTDKGLYGQIQNQMGNNDLLFSLRRDDNDAFGKYSTGNAAWGYAFSKTLRLTASYGTAFRAPTFNELYFPNYGNPNLQPEKSKSVETGLHGKQAWGGWDVRAYQTSIDHLINTVCDINFNCTAANVDEARIRGLETQVSTTLAGWRSGLSLSITDPRDVATNHVLPRRSKRTLRLNTDHSFGKTRFGMTWLAQGRRFDDAANTVVVGGYGLLNLRAEYDLSKDWRVRAHLDNVFDKQYETVHNYNTPGRSVFVSLGYQMR